MRTPVPYLAALALVAGCTPDARSPAEPQSVAVPIFESASAVDASNFRTHARGSEEVPANDSRAQGQAIFALSDDGDAISYKLIVANIENVTQSHIHIAPEGVNGPVVVWLYPSAPPSQLIPGRSQGVLAEGEFTAADLRGPLAGQTLGDLLANLRSGNAYVNVHTVAHPPGEIRGQIH
ncbi:MAG: CHRD domain-containing protein [Gemmatimonadota bacterium]